ncbi:hypothetical protein [Sphingomonas sp. MS122]|uniref:hypothetical protein n=1 Tax=Sphingomonas sp. MS122 TaxID=3412683 RepID=UPI003C306DED
MNDSIFQAAKLWLVDHTGLAKDALHVHIALALFLGSCLLLRWPLRSWKPWLLVLVAAIAGEAWDIRDSLASGYPLMPAANWQDVWNAMVWPSAILLLARTTKLFQTRASR